MSGAWNAAMQDVAEVALERLRKCARFGMPVPVQEQTIVALAELAGRL